MKLQSFQSNFFKASLIVKQKPLYATRICLFQILISVKLNTVIRLIIFAILNSGGYLKLSQTMKTQNQFSDINSRVLAGNIIGIEFNKI